MKIGVLTSSRADYGIYQPLLNKLKINDTIDLEIIAFGMHLQENQGNTIQYINEDGYEKVHKVGTMPEDDSILGIATGYGNLVLDFSDFWIKNSYDLVFTLGDRWEMSAAIQASIPFEVKLAHIHGGETTLGAIDNIFRHQITLASKYHFTASEIFSKRVKELIGKNEGVYTVGSISLEDLNNLYLPDWSLIKENFDIPFNEFVLVTFHPESINPSENKLFSKVTYFVLEQLKDNNNILITGANSDAMSSYFNEKYKTLELLYPKKIKFVKVLGKYNYFKAIKKSKFMLGNTSSGIIESASFNKWVINVGDRQKGRLRNDNIIDVPFDVDKILDAVSEISNRKKYQGENKYAKKGTTENIIKIITQNERL